jgi:hypothetical protein
MSGSSMHACYVEQVLRIRLSDRIQKDHIAWAMERTGVFSVKSAYRLAMELERDLEGVAWALMAHSPFIKTFGRPRCRRK